MSKFNNKKHRRLTALLLCVALMLGSVTSVSADISAADSETEVQNYAEEPTTEAVSYETPEAQAEVQEGTPVAEETEAPAADTQQTEAHTEAATEAHTETAAETVHTEIQADEQQVQKEASEETKVSEEVQLTQDMKNAEGKTICKVIADLPEGTFNADTSEITMEVKAVSSEDEEAVVKLIKNALTENTSLGNFVMYHVSFKVNGEDAEPQKSVSITFKDTELDVQDVKNATVFYYNPANSDAGNKDAELVPIIQRDELIKDLQKEEQEIPDNFDEIYDTSEITLTDKGAADEIQMDAWKNRIYGCYVTETTAGDTDADETAAEEPKTAINAIAAVAANNGNVTLTESYGKLTASYTGSLSASDYKYVWYRSVNGGSADVQKPVQYQDVNTGANLGQDISADGTELYIALNGGALGCNGNTSVSYYVKVFEAADVDSDGTPKSEAEALATSQSVSVTSYYELQNGSFEKPVIGWNWSQIANDSYKKNDGVWQTTGVDGAIEVINADYPMDSAYRWYGTGAAAEGKQFVELNCEAEGSLYQDVLTTPGETLNYQLAHRARGLKQTAKSEEDTMYVVIMPTQTAIEKNVTTQSQVQDVIANQKNYPGAMVVKYTDNDQAWTTHQGSYTVTASGQYSTRFFFVAGKTATNNVKEGNFLDDVKFTRSKLTPVEGTANVTVEKSIVGLEYVTAFNLAQTLTFKIGSETVKGSDMNWTWSNDGNTLTGSTIVTLKRNECGTNLGVEETATGSLDVANYTRSSSVTVDRTTTPGTSGTLSISTGDSKSVAFRNVYTANGGGSGDEPEASLSHEKYIKRNVDGTYDITLNASGTVGSKTNPAKVDIVLIVDTSGSMDDDKKLATTKDAIQSLVDVFNAKGDSVDVKYKLVTFARYASIVTNQWVDGNTLYDKVKSLKADGGTNYDQGFQKGKTAIDSARAEAKKVVIFLTDGQPTYYGTKPSGRGNATSTKTLTTALNSAATIACTDFYAVGIGLPDKVKVYSDDDRDHTRDKYIDQNYKNLTGQGVLDLIKNKVNAATKDAWNLTKDANGTYSSLTNKFQQIAGQTLTAACSNVVITDQLSDYVDVTDNSKLRVKVAERNTAGAYSDKYSQDFALDVTGNNANVTVDGETIATVSYNATTKTAILDFTDSYKLKADYYYYLTITNVIPNKTAFNQYAENNYSYGTTVGDASTDEGTGGYFATGDAKQATTGKITSSVQPGFFSNAKATVSYKNKESGSTITEEYAKPVVQVQIIPVKKVWSGAEPDDGTKILVQLVDQDGSPVDGKILELSKDNKWQNKLVVEKASKYDNYSYRELVADEKGSITYQNQKYSMASAGSDIVINHTSYKVTYSYEDDTRVITNTKNDQSMKIVKQNNSGINLEGATFTLKDAQNQSTEYTSDANGIVFNNNINYGTYTLKEIKAPNGYALLNADITITVDQNGVTVSGSEKASVKKEKDGTYTIIVKNDMLYSLPSTGGSGIYWFSICGMLLMMAAAWIIYKNKCREVLVK
ncbi:MAG: SpaA isopeptide-forming pilin-related protein [Coprococcus catus]|nr:SpaA isopeptide-forming pilin-related protein [Coprococcus catus]